MTGFGLVLDSDMLFHGNPQELADWFQEPKAMFMQDVADAYGYSPSLMCELAGRPMLSNVNVGLYALDRRRIDWEWIERCCERQLEAEGPNYLQEQGLTALELTHQDAGPLSAHRYIVMPDYAEGISPTAVLHHYVAHSKRSYFQHGWRLVQAQLNNSI